MKKIILLFFVSFVILFLFSGIASAATLCIDPSTNTNNSQQFIQVGQGFVPCGNDKTTITVTNPGGSTTIIPDQLACRCELGHVFVVIAKIYKFIVLDIATPLAALLMVLGGLLIVISGGPGGKNPVTGTVTPNMYTNAKNMLMGAAVGLFFIFGSWLIVNVILRAIGYTSSWSGITF